MVKSTLTRQVPEGVQYAKVPEDHRIPTSRHSGGWAERGPWKGCHRILDRSARKRQNKRTWQAEIANARRRAMLAKSGILDEADGPQS